MEPEQWQMFEEGKYHELIEYFKSLLRSNPQDFDAMRDLALCYTRVGPMQEAQTLYKRILREEPEDVDSLVNLGFVLLTTKQYRPACNILHQAIRVARRNKSPAIVISQAYTNLGVVFSQTQHFEHAVFYYALALEICPENRLASKYLTGFQRDAGPDRGILRAGVTADGSHRRYIWYYKAHHADVGKQQEILIQAVLDDKSQGAFEPQAAEAIGVAWSAIIQRIEKDPSFLFRVSEGELEEFVAAAYKEAGWPDVKFVESPSACGHDIVVSKPGFGMLRVLGEIKAFAPGVIVSIADLKPVLEILASEPDGLKGIITTTASFTREINGATEQFQRDRLELWDAYAFRERLSEIAPPSVPPSALMAFLEQHIGGVPGT